MGHVDHGKTKLLDAIRSTNVVAQEAGGITQHIGAYQIVAHDRPITFLDTPGHEAFNNLRKRGGSIADLAILVIDITQGVQEQTKESIEVLRQFKVPFVIAANKVDLVPDWKAQNTLSYLESLSHQKNDVKEFIDNKVYNLMAEFGNYGMNCDLFNKVDDFTKSVAIIPCSGYTGKVS